MKVLVVGGGIGGLALALSLHAAGIDDVEVFEAAPEMLELGVGINVLPHAVRELTELGLGDDLAAAGVATAELVMFNKHGQRSWAEPRGIAAGLPVAAGLDPSACAARSPAPGLPRPARRSAASRRRPCGPVRTDGRCPWSSTAARRRGGMWG